MNLWVIMADESELNFFNSETHIKYIQMSKLCFEVL